MILFDKAPYEDRLGRELPLGFLHDVYEVSDFDAQIARLRQAGARFLMEPQVIEAAFGTRRIAFKSGSAESPNSAAAARNALI